MDPLSLAKRLREAADAQLASIVERLPKKPESKFVWFLEIQRAFDTHTIQRLYGARNPTGEEIAFNDILGRGMNLATAHLLLRLNVPFAIPIGRSSRDTRTRAIQLLYSFGLVNLARRTADMVEHGFLLSELGEEAIILRDAGNFGIQFADLIQPDLLRRFEADRTSDAISPEGWKISKPEQLESLELPGRFWAISKVEPENLLSPEQLKDQMLPLIKPWKIPQGVLMGYGAAPEIDVHFLNEAGPIILEFKADAGIHPSTDFGRFSGEELLKVTWVLFSLFRKHVVFSLLAKQHIPEISVQESLTIWGPKSALIDSIAEVLGMRRATVKAALSALTIGPRDIGLLERETTPLLPYLVDLGNGYALRPVSALLRNPLAGFHTIANWRNSSSRNASALSREAWLRDEIYSLFKGNRYTCVDGNIMLRKDGKKLTDIDAAVFDRTNGELALIQIKWQDYLTSDIRALRSKARNLATEVDAWSKRVSEWIACNPPEKLAQTLRLKLVGPQRITSIFQFVVSRSVAKPHGYGFPICSPYLSITSWHQLQRLRYQIGPAASVIGRLHEVLREEEDLVVSDITPIPVEIELQGIRLRYENLWNKWDDELTRVEGGSD